MRDLSSETQENYSLKLSIHKPEIAMEFNQFFLVNNRGLFMNLLVRINDLYIPNLQRIPGMFLIMLVNRWLVLTYKSRSIIVIL